MPDNGTLLCIHRDPAQLTLLQENGYELVTATNLSDGLRLLMTHSVDAIVLEYPLGLLDGAAIATEIRKKAKPKLQSTLSLVCPCGTIRRGAIPSTPSYQGRRCAFLWDTVPLYHRM